MLPKTRISAPLLAFLVSLIVVPAASAAPFGPTSVWNAPLRADAPLASNNAALAAGIQAQVAASTPWINTTQYSTPVYDVGPGQARVKVTLDTSVSPSLSADFASVPLPVGAKPSAGSDGHLVVNQPGTDSMWEFFGLSKQADGWHAKWGGKMGGVSANPGYFGGTFGATASGLPLAGGLIRTAELQSGTIPHAVDFGIPAVRAGVATWPAQRTDGNSTAATAIPEGTRFRLPADLNLDALGLSPAVKTIARAVQQYGLVIRDRSGSTNFYAEDPSPTGANPYPTIFGTPYFSQALAKFPWAKLQAVAPNTAAFAASVAGPAGSAGTSPAALAASGADAAAPTTAATTAAKKAVKRRAKVRRCKARAHGSKKKFKRCMARAAKHHTKRKRA